jgi:hypothetical protein
VHSSLTVYILADNARHARFIGMARAVEAPEKPEDL